MIFILVKTCVSISTVTVHPDSASGLAGGKPPVRLCQA
jgi:hypothetical protein